MLYLSQRRQGRVKILKKTKKEKKNVLHYSILVSPDAANDQCYNFCCI